MSRTDLLDYDVFDIHDKPQNPGQQIHVDHKGCPAGRDRKKRLYIKMKEDGSLFLAFCQHCGRSRYRPTGKVTIAPVVNAPTNTTTVREVIDETARAPCPLGRWQIGVDPAHHDVQLFFRERRVDTDLIRLWKKYKVFPNYLLLEDTNTLKLSIRRNIICSDGQLLDVDVGYQVRHLKIPPSSNYKYITEWRLSKKVRAGVHMTPSVIQPGAVGSITTVGLGALVFTEDLITALRFASAGIAAVPCYGASNLDDNLLYRTAQDYPYVRRIAFAFDNDGTAIERIQEKALTTAECLFSEVVYDPVLRYDRENADTALKLWGWL